MLPREKARLLGRATLQAMMSGSGFRNERERERLVPALKPAPSIADAIRSGKLTLEAALATYGESASAGTRRKWEAAARSRAAAASS